MAERVLVLNHFAVPDGAPGGTRHVEMFGALSDRWDVRIIAADRNLLDRRRTVTDDPRFRFVWTSPYTSNGVARILNWVSYAIGSLVAGASGPKPSIVYASSPHLLAAAAGLAVARLRRVPFVLEVRDLWPQILVDMGRMSQNSLLYRALTRLERYLYRSADAIVVLARGSEFVIRRIVGEEKRVLFIPNGADIDRFAVVEPDQDTLPVTFMYAGAHGPANGLDLLLDAAAKLEATGPHIRVVLVGDGVVKEALAQRARLEKIGNVEFAQPVPKADMPDVLAGAQIGVHVLADVPLFRFGVSPNKLFEYMAAGLPVITNVPGEVGDLVREAEAGIAVEPEHLESAMLRMAQLTPSERRSLGAKGRRWVAAHRSRGALAVEIEALLDSLVGRGGS